MRKIILLLLVLSFYLSPVQAQTPANNTAAPLNLTQTNKQLDTITAKLNSGKASKEETADFVDQLTQIQSALVQARQSYAAELDAVQKKLNALGTPPEKPPNRPQLPGKEKILRRRPTTTKPKLHKLTCKMPKSMKSTV